MGEGRTVPIYPLNQVYKQILNGYNEFQNSKYANMEQFLFDLQHNKTKICATCKSHCPETEGYKTTGICDTCSVKTERG